MTSAKQKVCGNCGKALEGRQAKWCSPECSADSARATRLAAHFSITPAEYDAVLAEQQGGCGICGRKPTEGKRHAVDHDHQTGLVRGLLCFMCNKRVLGARSAAVIIATAAYVSDPPAQRVLGERVAAGRPRKKRQPRKRRRSR